MLVDKDIKGRAREIFISGFNEEHLGCISYDIQIGKILKDDNEEELVLAPGDYVMIESEEEFIVPKDLAVIIGEKNSLIRTGLVVNGPTFFPGHHTKAYLRVINASSNQIRIKKGMKIAQMFFFELSQVPENPYQSRDKDSFANETTYREYGKYRDSYNSQITKLEEATERLAKQEGKLYSNILTMMGIFVSVFALLTVDFTAISLNANIRDLALISCSLGLILVLFMGLIFLIINSSKQKIQNDKGLYVLMFVAGIFLTILLIVLFLTK